MDESLISLFIDDEMDLDEKIVFVETVHTSRPFTLEAVALLEQEKLLRTLPVPAPKSALAEWPDKPVFSWSRFFRSWWPPVAGFVTAMILVGLGFMLMPSQPTSASTVAHRFVLYLPEASQARIVGTFTDWNPVPMHKIGTSGYWSLTLPVAQGEHRYSYLVEDGNRMVDPTVTSREHDDFGGDNSVIVIGGGDVHPVS
jgi:hypothetical protein